MEIGGVPRAREKRLDGHGIAAPVVPVGGVHGLMDIPHDMEHLRQRHGARLWVRVAVAQHRDGFVQAGKRVRWRGFGRIGPAVALEIDIVPGFPRVRFAKPALIVQPHGGGDDVIRLALVELGVQQRHQRFHGAERLRAQPLRGDFADQQMAAVVPGRSCRREAAQEKE